MIHTYGILNERRGHVCVVVWGGSLSVCSATPEDIFHAVIELLCIFGEVAMITRFEILVTQC